MGGHPTVLAKELDDTDRAELWPELVAEAGQHLSFGAGIHYCLGAPLGRLELELSFGTLLRRLPTMAPAAEPAWKPTYILRGLEALHVTTAGGGGSLSRLTRSGPAPPC